MDTPNRHAMVAAMLAFIVDRHCGYANDPSFGPIEELHETHHLDFEVLEPLYALPENQQKAVLTAIHFETATNGLQDPLNYIKTLYKNITNGLSMEEQLQGLTDMEAQIVAILIK